jgi:hypothetical protein
MNWFLIATLLALSVFTGSAAAQQSSQTLLANASVIKLPKTVRLPLKESPTKSGLPPNPFSKLVAKRHTLAAL